MNISLAGRIEPGTHILFNLEHQSIKILPSSSLLKPFTWPNHTEEWICLLLKDEDSCMHIAGLISALTGLILGESKKTPFGIVFPLLQQSC